MADQVQVDVKDLLSTVFPHIELQSVSDQFIFFGEALGGDEQMAEQRFLRRCRVRDGFDVFARHNEEMHAILRVDVGEGDALLVFVGNGGGDTFIYNLAKKTLHR